MERNLGVVRDRFVVVRLVVVDVVVVVLTVVVIFFVVVVCGVGFIFGFGLLYSIHSFVQSRNEISSIAKTDKNLKFK